MKSSPYFPGVILLAGALLLSLFWFRDYGVAFDEQTQREIGIVSYAFAFYDDPKLLTYIEKDHGVGFEVPLVAAEVFATKAFGMTDPGHVYALRHLLTHLFFLAATFCGYLLVYALFKNRWLASLAFLMLVFQPRIYAHSYFNTKDIPFLAMFLVCLWLAELAFRRNRAGAYVLLGMAVGYTISIRILGVVLVACLAAFFAMDLLSARLDRRTDKSASPGRVFGYAVLFFAACGAALYVSWPVLWAHPLDEFVAEYRSLSHFRWNNGVLFEGEILKAAQLPARYLPEWIAISTPLLWLGLGAVGLLAILAAALRSPLRYLRNTRERNFLLYVGCFALPLFSVIMLHSIVYDDWRHLYFVYPCLVLAAMFVLDALQRTRLRLAANLAWVAQAVAVAAFMLMSHPFEQVYFNALTSHGEQALRYRYDRDYWGASYKQALEYIVRNDPRPRITVRYAYPIENNLVMLPPEQRRRIVFVNSDTEPFDYFLTTFRDHPGDYPFATIAWEAKVQNSTVVRVYRMARPYQSTTEPSSVSKRGT